MEEREPTLLGKIACFFGVHPWQYNTPWKGEYMWPHRSRWRWKRRCIVCGVEEVWYPHLQGQSSGGWHRQR